MELGLSTWSEFKTICVDSKNLKLQYSDMGSSYRVVGPDFNSINWVLEIPKKLPDDSDNPDAITFEENYKSSCNQPIIHETLDGLPQVNSIPAVSTSKSYFCPPVSGSVTTVNSNVDYTIADSYVQLSGMELETIGAEVGDSIQFEVGVIVGGNWILLVNYGGKHFIGPNWNLSFFLE